MKTDLVVAGFVFYKNKVLLVHHKKLDLWLPVGGHIDKNETPDNALLREIKEEIGIKTKIFGKNMFPTKGNAKENLAIPFHVNLHSAGNHDHCCFFYVCKTQDNNIRINDEIKGFGWFSRNDLTKSHVPKDVKHMGLMAFNLIKKYK